MASSIVRAEEELACARIHRVRVEEDEEVNRLELPINRGRAADLRAEAQVSLKQMRDDDLLPVHDEITFGRAFKPRARRHVDRRVQMTRAFEGIEHAHAFLRAL